MSTVTNEKDRTRAVDELLAVVAGLPRDEAAAMLQAIAPGVSEGAVQRWRQLRADGKPIPLPRGDVRRGLQAFMARERRLVVREPRIEYGATASLEAVGDVERLLILRVLALLSQYVAGGPETSDLRTLIAVLASIPDPPKE